jgi:hypothetical protein
VLNGRVRGRRDVERYYPGVFLQGLRNTTNNIRITGV